RHPCRWCPWRFRDCGARSSAATRAASGGRCCTASRPGSASRPAPPSHRRRRHPSCCASGCSRYAPNAQLWYNTQGNVVYLANQFVTAVLRAGGASVLVLALGVAQAAPSTISAPATRTVTDDSGRTLSVGPAPLRIVSLAPGATEMLFAAGAGAQVIATVEYSDEPPAARRIARIGDVAAVDLERLVALHPDVVVLWAGGGNPAQREKIAGLRIPIYQQQVARLADIPAAVRRLGALAATAVVAERAAATMEARLAALTATYGA